MCKIGEYKQFEKENKRYFCVWDGEGWKVLMMENEDGVMRTLDVPKYFEVKEVM